MPKTMQQQHIHGVVAAAGAERRITAALDRSWAYRDSEQFGIRVVARATEPDGFCECGETVGPENFQQHLQHSVQH